jgi:hypothetical protein
MLWTVIWSLTLESTKKLFSLGIFACSQCLARGRVLDPFKLLRGGHSSTFNLQFYSAGSATTVWLRGEQEPSSHPRDIGAKASGGVETCRGLFKHNLTSHGNFSRVETGKNTSTVIPASRKRRRKGNRISLRWDSVSHPKRRLIRTYFWISLFTSYRITANYLIESNVILIPNKEF